MQLHDLTIRDGEECADLAFNTEDKVRIAEMLAAVGIRRSEVFLTVPGWTGWYALMARHLPLDLWVTWQPGRVERALDLGVKHVMVWYRIGEDFAPCGPRNRDERMDEMLSSVPPPAREDDVESLLAESTRADLEHITAAARA
ncbi:MAG: hypothetical protein R2856_22720 [Caldilineaceae bacterium]